MISPRDHRRKPQPPKKRKKKGLFARFKSWLADKFDSLHAFVTNRWLSFMGSVIFTFAIIGMLALGYFAWGLPDTSSLDKIKKTPSITIKAENGDILGTYGDIYGEYVSYKQIPPELIKAVVATEDRNFFEHHGIDIFGITRAIFVNFRAGHVVQGGSTITQQLAKNLFLTPERTMKRKVQEMLLAFKLETRYTKEQILTLYLNRVYLGSGNFGVDAASRRYFKKPVRDINLNEAAILTGLLKAPSRYAPTNNPQLSRNRAIQVLHNMVDADMLKQSELEKAVKLFGKPQKPTAASTQGTYYFSDWILEQIPDFIGNTDKDIVVVTTLMPTYQKMAEESLNAVLDENGEKLKIDQGALLSMTPDGAVRAMVGGRDYTDSQFNRATQAMRQPGSAFKLFVYLAGIEAGFAPDTVFEDKPIRYGKWAPKNYTGKYLGPVSLHTAFAESINTVAVQLAQQVGVGQVVGIAKRLGINSQLRAEASIALGTNVTTLLEMTTGYAHMAANGRAVVPYAILKISDDKGHTLYQREGSDNGQVLSTSTVYAMNDMLLAVVNEGTGRAALIGRPAAGKTGTSQDFRDAWFLGFVPQLVTGVWVGNDDNSEMNHVTGGKVPALIWKRYMQQALKTVPVADIPSGYTPGGRLPWATEGEQPQDSQGDRDMELSPDFWDKLFDGNGNRDGRVEYDYPTPNR